MVSIRIPGRRGTDTGRSGERRTAASAAIAWRLAGLALLLLCVHPALASIPSSFSYADNVTLVNDQDSHGGCIGYSFTHVLEILDELEAPYTPDPSYAYLNYVFLSATEGQKWWTVDPRIPHNPTEGGVSILTNYGLPPETSYPTDFSTYGETEPEMLNRPPSNEVFNQAKHYRILSRTFTNYSSVSTAEEWIATKGPLICNDLFPAHTVALIGYDRNAQRFTMVDSDGWGDISHAGIKTVPYAYFASRQPNMSIEALVDAPTPLEFPYTARIALQHYQKRSMFTVKIGVVGHDPMTVWDQNNLNKYTDLSPNLTIDVPLPSYAAEHWPPSAQDQWYVQIENHDPQEDGVLREVSLVKRYATPDGYYAGSFDRYQMTLLPWLIKSAETKTFFFFNKGLTIDSQKTDEHWFEGETRTITWSHSGLMGTTVTLAFRRTDGSQTYPLAYLIPVDNNTPSSPLVSGSTRSFTFTVPQMLEDAAQYNIRVQSDTYASVSGISDGVVTILNADQVDFTAVPTTGQMPLAVQFTDTSAGEPIAWYWQFGDGGTSTLRHPSHTYTQPGTFMVSLRATYPGGVQRYVNKPSYISVRYGQASFTATPTTGFHPLAVQFTDTSSGSPILACAWSFGDGATSTLQHPSHTYAAPGTYTVTLNTTYPLGQVSTCSSVITVKEALKPGFTANAWCGYQPFPVQFTDLTTGGPTSWLWEFGDGATSTLQHPGHTYTAPGTYAVTLTVANAAAGTQTLQKTGYILVHQMTGGRILVQAEDFGNGGEGVDSHDTTPGNSGGAYRPDQDVDIAAFSIPRSESGFVITDIQTGEWTRYFVWNAGSTERDAPCSLRFANADGSLGVRTVTITVDGLPNTVTVNVPYTGSSTTFALVNTTVRLRPYGNTIRFTYQGSGYRFDSFLVDPPSSAPTPTPTAQPIKVVPGGSAGPHWVKTEGKFDDVNGNFRLDFADVTLYFNQMTWIAANEPVSAFDYNGNGRIDFADVIWLFNNL